MVAIQRLRKNGVPLETIEKVTPGTMAAMMALRTETHTALPSNQALRLWRDMTETFKGLPDLHALVHGTQPEIEAMLERT